MLAYILRRFLYAIPILIGVNVLTFILFFMVNTPDQMARVHLGDKHVSQDDIDNWKVQRGYDKPLFLNVSQGGTKTFTETIFFQKSIKLLAFDFGKSDEGRNIKSDIKERMWPSLAVQIPTFVIGLLVNICFALLIVMFRSSLFEITALTACVAMLSISSVFYIIGGQFFFAKLWNLVPISGYLSGMDAISFLILPIIIGVISGVGSGTRLYRTIFIEEASRDYMRTARAKGVSELSILFKHLLPNGMIPILTSVVVVIPTLFMGSLLIESFFGIPGLGSYTLDAIQAQDFAVVRCMVFLGACLYIVGLLLTDISYTLVDPRVKLS